MSRSLNAHAHIPHLDSSVGMFVPAAIKQVAVRLYLRRNSDEYPRDSARSLAGVNSGTMRSLDGESYFSLQSKTAIILELLAKKCPSIF